MPVRCFSETQSRALNVKLAELALQRLGARPFHVIVPTPAQRAPVPIRSTGASVALQGLGPVIQALSAATFVADCTVEGLMHAAELPAVLKGGARVLYISNEHPEVLERLVPSPADEQQVRGRCAGCAKSAVRLTIEEDYALPASTGSRWTPHGATATRMRYPTSVGA